jgi:hypothetical protein
MEPMSCPQCGVAGQPAETYTDSEGQEGTVKLAMDAAN